MSDFKISKKKIAVFPDDLKTKCLLVDQLYKDSQYDVYEVNNFNDDRLSHIKPDLILTSFCVNGTCDCSQANFIGVAVDKKDCQGLKIKNLMKIQCSADLFFHEIKNLTQSLYYLDWLNVDINRLACAHCRKAILLLDENTFYTAEFISKKTGLSKVHFSRVIKQNLNVSFTHFRLWLRVAKALYMIKTGGFESINYIADRLNYSCSSNIYRDFAKTIRINPSLFISQKNLQYNLPSYFKDWDKKGLF